MPKENQDGQEKTEAPSSKKLGKARSQGQVAKSQEINSIAIVGAGVITLVAWGGWMLTRIMEMARKVYLGIDEINIDLSNVQGYAMMAGFWVMKTLSPIVIVIIIVALIVNYYQVGWVFTTFNLKPKLSKLNPVQGAKRLFNQRAVFTLAKNLLKLTIIGGTAYLILKDSYPTFKPLMDASVGQIFLFLVKMILKVLTWTLIVMAIIAIIDYIYEKYKWTEDMKMTKTEKKEERRMSEGDPKVKQKQRELQFQMAFNSMIKELPKADVVVTNPIHVAVALRYDNITMTAPTVIGKGMRKIAERIKSIARENEIPIVENPPLARALYKTCQIGDEIPGQFYQDVAEILAQIYEMRENIRQA